MISQRNRIVQAHFASDHHLSLYVQWSISIRRRIAADCKSADRSIYIFGNRRWFKKSMAWQKTYLQRTLDDDQPTDWNSYQRLSSTFASDHHFSVIMCGWSISILRQIAAGFKSTDRSIYIFGNRRWFKESMTWQHVAKVSNRSVTQYQNDETVALVPHSEKKLRMGMNKISYTIVQYEVSE